MYSKLKTNTLMAIQHTTQLKVSETGSKSRDSCQVVDGEIANSQLKKIKSSPMEIKKTSIRTIKTNWVAPIKRNTNW